MITGNMKLFEPVNFSNSIVTSNEPDVKQALRAHYFSLIVRYQHRPKIDCH